VVIQGYGLTETSSLISLKPSIQSGPQVIGKVLPGREIKLDPRPEKFWCVAKTWPAVLAGQRVEPVTGAEGWFRTGDLGAMDAEGNLYFKGRSKNVIVTPAGAEDLSEDLEQALRKQQEVRDCVVFGVARGGNAEACAVLLLRNGTSGNAVVAMANQSLADFQKIRCWLVWPDEDFPRTSTQKPKLDAIRRVAEAQVNDTQSNGEQGGNQIVIGEQVVIGQQVVVGEPASAQATVLPRNAPGVDPECCWPQSWPARRNAS